MDQTSILAYLSNLLNGQTMDYLNDPYSHLGVQNMLQMQQQNQMLSDQDVARLLDISRGISTRATIPTRSVGSIFNQGTPGAVPQATPTANFTPVTGYPTGPKLEQPAANYGYIDPITQGIINTAPYQPMDQRDIVARTMHERQVLNPVGGIFPSTLKDYWTTIFQPRPAIYRGQAPIGPTYSGPNTSRGGNIYGR